MNKYKQEILDALDKGQIGESPGQVIGAIAGAVVGLALAAVGLGGLSLMWMGNLAFYAAAAGSVIAGATIGAAIGGIIDPPPPPDFDTGYSEEGSARYGFGELINTWTNEIPIPVLYGELKLAGNIIYQSAPGETVYRCVCLCEGEIEEIFAVKVNDVSISGSGTVTAGKMLDGYIARDGYPRVFYPEYTVHSNFELRAADGSFLSSNRSTFDYDKQYCYWTSVWEFLADYAVAGYGFTANYTNEFLPGCSYTTYLGTSTQTVDSRFSSEVDGLRYIASLAITLKTSEKLTGGNPTMTCIARGRKVNTWSGSAWSAGETYSRNPVACLRDLLTNARYGAGMPIAAIDATSWGAAYDYCNEQVQNIDGTSTEVRAQLDYLVDGKRPILDVINSILSTFNGFLVFSGSKIKLKIEKDESVSQAFDMTNILRGSFTYSKESKDNLPNRLKVQYIDPGYNYTKIFAQADDPIDQANRRTIGLGEDIVTKEVSLLGITRFSQASRQANLFLNISRACGTYCIFTVGPDALAAEVGDIITVTHDVAKWATKKFRILAIGATKDDKLALLCREHDSSIYTGYSSGALSPAIEPVADEKTAPNPVRQFTATQDINIIRFRWVAPIPKFNVIIDSYEIRVGVDWSIGAVLVKGLRSLTYETGDFPLGDITFWIKAISIDGVYSSAVVSDSITTTLPANYNAIFSYDEWDPENFKDRTITPGLETEWTTDRGNDYWNKIIALKNTTYYWDIASPLWDCSEDTLVWDEGPFYATEQTYTTDEIDIGSEQTAPITLTYDVYAAAETSVVRIEWRYRTTAGDYTPWGSFATGEYSLRYCQFKINLTTNTSANYMKFFRFKVRVDVVDIIDRGTASIVDAANGIVISYTQTYTTTPRITVSTRGSSPYNPLITASSKDTFTIKLRDPETTVYKTGVVDWHSVGY